MSREQNETVADVVTRTSAYAALYTFIYGAARMSGEDAFCSRAECQRCKRYRAMSMPDRPDIIVHDCHDDCWFVTLRVVYFTPLFTALMPPVTFAHVRHYAAAICHGASDDDDDVDDCRCCR